MHNNDIKDINIKIINISGVVLESYGAGNIPSNRDDVFNEIEAAVKRGVIFVNITQCTRGSIVTPLYETGRVRVKNIKNAFDVVVIKIYFYVPSIKL